jgi:predicted solute-binding protein
MSNPSEDDVELDRQWREMFGQPLPMLGAAVIARKVLEDYRARVAESA